MKPEPLKDKTQSHCQRKDLTDRHDIHDDVDINSAVGWLKNELKKHYWVEAEKEYVIPFEALPEIIDEAFEDVTKE